MPATGLLLTTLVVAVAAVLLLRSAADRSSGETLTARGSTPTPALGAVTAVPTAAASPASTTEPTRVVTPTPSPTSPAAATATPTPAPPAPTQAPQPLAVPASTGWLQFKWDAAELNQIQQSVDAGHQPWWLDPVQSARELIRTSRAYSPALRRFASSEPDSSRFGSERSISFTDGAEMLVVRLDQPVRKGRGGIWVPESYRLFNLWQPESPEYYVQGTIQDVQTDGQAPPPAVRLRTVTIAVRRVLPASGHGTLQPLVSKGDSVQVRFDALVLGRGLARDWQPDPKRGDEVVLKIARYTADAAGQFWGGSLSGYYYAQDGKFYDGQGKALKGATPTPATVAQIEPARREAQMAWDGASGKVILFSGVGGPRVKELRDTWAWNGSGWRNLNAVPAPPSRTSAAIAYDSERRQVVMFGGVGYSVMELNDTWTWDGRRWTEQHPATSPSWRPGAVMAFDAARGKAVLFGGEVHVEGTMGVFRALNETWTWDGRNWKQERPAVSPPPPVSALMTYDAARQQVVLFMQPENKPADAPAETWTWDGSTWTKQKPRKAPPARQGGSLVYDDSLAKVVLFGGSGQLTDFGQDPTLLDMWAWDGANWVQLPAENVPGDLYATAVYDPVREQIVAYSGVVSRGQQSESRTWLWDGTGWRLLK